MQSNKLPKMPAPRYCAADHGYTDLQMYTYALAARKAALKEVRAELERLYADLGEPLGGSYEAGQQTALDCFEGWVEQLMEKDA